MQCISMSTASNHAHLHNGTFGTTVDCSLLKVGFKL